jgi:hypothetical protein
MKRVKPCPKLLNSEWQGTLYKESSQFLKPWKVQAEEKVIKKKYNITLSFIMLVLTI